MALAKEPLPRSATWMRPAPSSITRPGSLSAASRNRRNDRGAREIDESRRDRIPDLQSRRGCRRASRAAIPSTLALETVRLACPVRVLVALFEYDAPAMSEALDVIIIGAGTAGLAALREVQKRTERFAIVNDGPYGTTCARVGCMPSKLLIEAADAFHRRHTFDAFGIRGGDALHVDVPAVLRRVRALRDEFVAHTLKITDGLGDRNIAGRAVLVGPDRVRIGDRELTARKIILATGSRPIVPAGWEALGDRLLTSDTLFDQDSLPARVGVIGLGAIGIELAQAMARLGIEVTGFEMGERLGGLTDEVVNARCLELLRSELAIHLGAAAAPQLVEGGIELRAGDVTAVVDRVLVAIGRRPNLDHLGLDTLGVPLDARGMPPVDPTTMRVADLPVFLAGDANGRAPLLHEAADDGHIAGMVATADDAMWFRRRVPLAVVFTEPTIAMVGRRLAELDPATTLIGEARFERQGRARAAQRAHGLVRAYAARDGHLLGAELCAPAGDHFAHLLALAIERDSTVHDLLRMPFYHPVLEEGLRTALRALARQLPVPSASDLACCEPLGSDALE